MYISVVHLLFWYLLYFNLFQRHLAVHLWSCFVVQQVIPSKMRLIAPSNLIFSILALEYNRTINQWFNSSFFIIQYPWSKPKNWMTSLLNLKTTINCTVIIRTSFSILFLPYLEDYPLSHRENNRTTFLFLIPTNPTNHEYFPEFSPFSPIFTIFHLIHPFSHFWKYHSFHWFAHIPSQCLTHNSLVKSSTSQKSIPMVNTSIRVFFTKTLASYLLSHPIQSRIHPGRYQNPYWYQHRHLPLE